MATVERTPTNKTAIQFFAFPKKPEVTSASGFCQKLEAYFRFANLKYEHKDGSPLKAPKGKLPYIIHENDTVCDTQAIIEWLDANKDTLGFAGNLDTQAGLTGLEKSMNNAYRAYIEEYLYFCVVEERWLRQDNRTAMINESFSDIPWIFRGTLVWFVVRGLRNALKGQGIARHSREEIDKITNEILDDLEIRLGSNREGEKWFNGIKGPCTIDATLYGLLSTIVGSEANPVVKKKVLESPALTDYLKRITEEYFPEYETVRATIEATGKASTSAAK